MTITLEELKELRELKYDLDSVIAMLRRKRYAKENYRHFFIVKGGRNFCEFCGQAYRFENSDSRCMPERITSDSTTAEGRLG